MPESIRFPLESTYRLIYTFLDKNAFQNVTLQSACFSITTLLIPPPRLFSTLIICFVTCICVANCVAARCDARSGRHIQKFSVLKIANVRLICVGIKNWKYFER
jgi:hypothetical protein